MVYHVKGVGNLFTDSHIGRIYKNGVPLNRLGDREKLVMDKFEEELSQTCSEKTIIHLGDIFNAPVVPLDVIKETYCLIYNMALRNSDHTYWFVAGNHDLSRNSERTDALEILSILLAPFKNVKFVLKEPTMIHGNLVAVPYSYTKSNEEMLGKYFKCGNNPKIFVGHFEEPIDPYLSTKNIDIYSGHIHKQHRNGNVFFIGSSLPVVHGEESNDDMFVTLSLDEVLCKKETGELKNKCVRVVLKEGEVLPDDIDCLQLLAKKNEEEVVSDLSVDFESFDVEKLFRECLSDNPLTDSLWEKYLIMKTVEE